MSVHERSVVVFAFPDNVRASLKDNEKVFHCYTIKGVPIYEVTNEDMLSYLKLFVERLTPEIMDNYMGTDIYTESMREKYQLDQLVKVAEIYQMETILQIMRLFERCDIKVSPAQAEFMWSVCSDEVFASWLCNEDDNKTWKMILTEVIANHKIQKIIDF